MILELAATVTSEVILPTLPPCFERLGLFPGLYYYKQYWKRISSFTRHLVLVGVDLQEKCQGVELPGRRPWAFLISKATAAARLPVRGVVPGLPPAVCGPVFPQLCQPCHVYFIYHSPPCPSLLWCCANQFHTIGGDACWCTLVMGSPTPVCASKSKLCGVPQRAELQKSGMGIIVMASQVQGRQVFAERPFLGS